MGKINIGKPGVWFLWNVSQEFLIWLFLLRTAYLEKKLISFWAGRTCADLKKQYNNMVLKTVCKALSLVSKLLFRFDWLKMKTKFELVMVTFHSKLSADEIFNITDEAKLAFFQNEIKRWKGEGFIKTEKSSMAY